MVSTKHTLLALVSDRPGVLTRMASLFRRRGFNIESLAVGHSELPNFSRMTIVVSGPAAMVEQVRKQVSKIVDVVKVTDVTEERITVRELALIKVNANADTRSKIIEIVDIFRAGIVDVAAESLTIEITGDGEKIDSLINLLRGFGIKEVNRTGSIAMTRGGTGPISAEEKTGRVPT
jgi:acetolactate synthase-1/3 small subunit